MSIVKFCLFFLLYFKVCHCQLDSNNKGSEIKTNSIGLLQTFQPKSLNSKPNFSDNSKSSNVFQNTNSNKFISPQGGNSQTCFQQQIGRPPLQNPQQFSNCKGPAAFPTNFINQKNMNMRQSQQPSLQNIDLSLTSMPIINGEVSGLPSQVAQGVLLSNLGLTSSLPSLVSNSCNHKPDQSFCSPQNNAISNIGFPQFGNALPAGVPMPISSNGATNNNLPPSIIIPLSSKTSSSFQENSPSQGGFSLKSIHLTPLPQGFSQPNAVTQTQQVSGPYGGAEKMGSPFINMIPKSSEPNLKKKGKSSFKSLLPLLLNLLNENGNCCGCPNNPQNFNNHERISVPSNPSQNMNQPPQVSSGYANIINYGSNDVQTKEQNKQKVNKETDSEEFYSAEVSRRRRKYRKHKRRYDDEYDDDYISDEDED